MAKCDECGQLKAEDADACPNCGKLSEDTKRWRRIGCLAIVSVFLWGAVIALGLMAWLLLGV